MKKQNKKVELKFTVAEKARHWKVYNPLDSDSDFEAQIVQPIVHPDRHKGAPKHDHIASVVLGENAPVLAASAEMYDVLKKAKGTLGDLTDNNVKERMMDLVDLYGLIRVVLEKADVQDPDGNPKEEN